MAIRSGGLEIFPSLVPEQQNSSFEPQRVHSGIDELLGGGFDHRTVTFISGPTGAGKTTTGTQLLTQAAKDGLNSSIYLFEENIETFTHRAESIDIPVEQMREAGTLSVTEVEPLTLSSEEFAHMVKRQVEEEDTDIVMIDGIDGYTISIQGQEHVLVRKLHALTRYLKNQGVAVLITNEIPEITGISTATNNQISYIADNIAFVSYVEMDGSLRKVIGVLKKRTGGFEQTLREFEITPDGIRVGEPLTGLHGILQGSPRMGQTADSRRNE